MKNNIKNENNNTKNENNTILILLINNTKNK